MVALPVRRERTDRGAVLPSALIVFSILVLAVAGVTYFVTRDGEPTEREITTASQDSSDTPSDETSDGEDTDGSEEPTEEKTKKEKPPIDKATVGVNVFNNTSIAGLAAEVLVRVDEIGWNGLVSDDWYGTIPATTVYYPEGMKREGRQLALDLGVERVQPADIDSDMSTDNLTLILTGELG